MGFSISWIAFSGKSKQQVLSALNVIDTTEPDEANESPISGAALRDGWYLVFLNDCFHPLIDVETLKRLSRGGTVLGCQVEEHIMVSAAFLYADGCRVWNLTHEAEKGHYNLESEGELPPAFEKIHQHLTAEQDREGGEEAGVDFLFDVPIELAASLCGYRHDQVALRNGEEPVFTQLAPAAS
jgi:hypothetical protein